MKLSRYLINAKPSWGYGDKLFLLASNIKEARNFCKDFDGLKIIEYIHGTITITWTDSINEIMQKQKEILQKGLANKTIVIEE